ncbi:MAG: DNA polymerase III subunit delta' [Vagococcus sp.]
METLDRNINEKQPQLHHFFKRVFEKKQLTHAYLMESNTGQDSYDLALWIAQSIFCEAHTLSDRPCGECLTCRRISRNDFSDVTTIVPDGQTIKVDQIRDIKQTFIRSGIESTKKVLIIRDSEKMTTSAANSLLKFIEEPDGSMYIFFLTHNANQVISTIQSRCQFIYLKPVSKQVLARTLVEDGFTENQANLYSELVTSSQVAVELSQDEWFNNAREVIQKWFDYINRKHSLSFVFVQQHVLKIGKEKEQQFMILDILLAYYKVELNQKVNNLSDSQIIALNIEKIMEAKQKLQANVSFQNACEQLVWRLIH